MTEKFQQKVVASHSGSCLSFPPLLSCRKIGFFSGHCVHDANKNENNVVLASSLKPIRESCDVMGKTTHSVSLESLFGKIPDATAFCARKKKTVEE